MKKSLIIIKCVILVFAQFLCAKKKLLGNSVVNTHTSVTFPSHCGRVDTCKLAASMLISELTLSPTIYMCQSFLCKRWETITILMFSAHKDPTGM